MIRKICRSFNCLIRESGKKGKCFYCKLEHKRVEASGVYYCPNALCQGPGAAWFRRKLYSYREIEGGKHVICEKERRVMGRLYNAARGIKLK